MMRQDDGKLRLGGSACVLAALMAAASVSAETVIVDNSLSGFSVLSGTWTTSPAPYAYNPGHTDCYGKDYRSKTTSSSGTAQVEWRPTLLQGGEYEVTVWYYSQGSSNPNNAHYVVYHSGGTTDVYVNQQIYGSQWVSLGVFNFDAGTAGRVTLTDQAQSSKTIMADAVRFQTTAPVGPQFRAAWVDVFHEGLQNKDQVDTMIQSLVAGGYNAVIPEVLAYHDNQVGSHGAYWRSNIVARSTYVTDTFEPLGYIIEQAHLYGLEVHPWIVAYRACTSWPPPGNPFLAGHPEWLMVPKAKMGLGPARVTTKLPPNDANDPYTFDPGSPDVQEYLVSIVRELVMNYEIDGIHWDYIRYTQYDAGYPADAAYANSGLARFQRITGRSDVPLSTGDAEWDDFRRRTIDELMRRCRAEIPAIRSNPHQPLRHTASLVPWGDAPSVFTNSSAYKYYQNWEMWTRLGWLDAAIPMMYYREYRTSGGDNQYQMYRNWVDAAMNWSYDRHMFIGQGIYMNTMNDSFTQMNYAESRGADGLVSYSYWSTFDADRGAVKPPDPDPDIAFYPSWYPFVASTLFNRTAETPSMPWRDPSLAVDGTLYGRVTDAWSGTPLDDATVEVVSVGSVQTDGNGYYVVTMIPSSGLGLSYDVQVSKAGRATMTVPGVHVPPGDVARQDVTFGLTTDCNANQIEDACELSCDTPGCGLPGCGTASDCNSNGIPDTCESDADYDWIPDDCDLCENTIPGIAVDANGCPPDVRADFDGDGDVDPTDMQAFEACASGPGLAAAESGCADQDMDSDGDVDQADFSLVQPCLSGENVPADPQCLPPA